MREARKLKIRGLRSRVLKNTYPIGVYEYRTTSVGPLLVRLREAVTTPRDNRQSRFPIFETTNYGISKAFVQRTGRTPCQKCNGVVETGLYVRYDNRR